MDMKKTVALITCITVMASVFFCVPVYAAQASFLNRKTTSVTVDGVTINVTAYQGYPYSFGTSLTGGYGQDTYIYVRIQNSTAVNKEISSIQITPNYASSAVLLNQDSITSDLVFGNVASDGRFYIAPSGDYAFSSSIIVPSTTSLYFFGVLTTRAEFNTSDQTVTGPALSSIVVNTPTVYDFDGYVNGIPQDLSQVENLLTQIYYNSGDIESILNDIRVQLAVSGTVQPIGNLSRSWSTYNFDSIGATMPNNFTASLRVVRLDSFALSENMINTSSGMYRHDCYVVPFQISITMNNNTGHAVKMNNNQLLISDILDRTSGASILFYGYESDLFGMPSVSGNVNSNYWSIRLPGKYQINNEAYIPSGLYQVNFVILAVFDQYDSSYNFNSGLSLATVFSTTEIDISYNPIFPIDEINRTLKMLYDAYAQVNGVDDLSDNSNSLTEGLNNAHQAEQNYFASNSEALSNSGISNPNFEASDRTGINSAITGNKNQFGLLWNAIGAWRNIYIYAALLGLVTYLLRHKPWISGGRRYRRDVES